MTTARRTVRFWAGLDFLVTLPLVVPPGVAVLLDLLNGLNRAFGGTGALSLSATGMLFACLTGALAVTWAVARWWRADAGLGRLDAVARLWVGAVIVVAVLQGLPPVLLLFVVTEWAGAAHQFFSLRRR